MKVVLLAPTPPPAGGIAAWTERMMKANLPNNWKVEIVDEKLIGNREVFGEKGKKNYLSEMRRCFIIWRNLFIKLNDKEVKVIHSCIPSSATSMLRETVCAILTKIRKRKFIIHYRCTIPNLVKDKKTLAIFKFLNNLSDSAFVLNKISSEFISKHNSKLPNTVIPNFINESELFEKDERHIREKVITVSYIGGVIEDKGCIDIIDVAKTFPSIEFKLIGKPEKKIIDMPKTPNVILTGELNKQEVQRELFNTDIFIFLSKFSGEGFSNALAEAMGAGLPCIVTDWAANQDMIENEGGVVVPINSVHEVVNALELMKDNFNLRRYQSNWNISKVKNNYLEPMVIEKYVNEYEKVINMGSVKSSMKN